MNFLSHYYVLKEENPYVVLGVILSDITTDFSKIYNQFIKNKYFPIEPNNILLLHGIKNHIKADDIFHNHVLFDKMQEIAKSIMKSTFGETVKRQFVIAHVLVELMLDQYIIENNEEILNDFYSKLEKIELEEANKFFKKLNVLENKSHFKRNFTKFRQLKILFHLKGNEGIIFTLNRVFSSRLQYNFVEEEQKWSKTIDDIKKEMNQYIPIIIEDVKTKLYE